MISVNGFQIKPTFFPDNTSQCWKLPDSIMVGRRWAFIEWNYTHEGEIMHIAQLRDLFADSGIHASLHMTYLPYARQDKQIKNDQTFALHTFARLLNAMNFDKVSCMDPHSKAAGMLINNFTAQYPIDLITKIFQDLKYPLLCYPDAGAGEKYDLIVGLPMIYGEKTRDQLTGTITDYTLVASPGGKSVLIVDDICDGGATFVILAKVLFEAGAKEVNLFVTHGIFSKGLQPLFDSGIKQIFTAKGEASEVQGNIAYKSYEIM